MEAWRSGTPLLKWAEAVEEDAPLSRLSPECTRIVTLYGSPRWELRVKDQLEGDRGQVGSNLPGNHRQGRLKR
jgi:hypothetical protein